MPPSRDVFDALTSVRVYKAAMSATEALPLLQSERSQHFAPELIELFSENSAEIEAVRQEFADEPEMENDFRK